MSVLRRILVPGRRTFPALLLAVLAGTLATLAAVALLAISGWLITATALAGLGLLAMLDLFAPGAGIRAAAVVRTVARYFERLIGHDATFRQLAELRVEAARGLLARPIARLEQLRAGETFSRLTRDIDQLDHLLPRLLLPALVAVLPTVLVVIVLALAFAVTLALALMVLLLGGGAIVLLLGAWASRKSGKEASTEATGMRTGLVEWLAGLAELVSLNRADDRAASVLAASRRRLSAQRRLARIEAGETVVVGVNKWTEAEPSPLQSEDGGILVVDPGVEADQIARLNAWRTERDDAAVTAALDALRAAAAMGENIMPASINAARAGVTTGEWAAQMRAVHGEYRGPTGVSGSPSNRTEGLDELREAVDAVSDRLGRRLSFLVGKPGLDGHSNGAEQIACRARDCGMEITYDGIRLTPEEIVAAARENEPHVVGLSILSGSHIPLVEDLMARMTAAGIGHIPVIVGGIIPEDDAKRLRKMGVARVYTPKDFALNMIMSDIVTLADPRAVAAE